MATSPNRRLSSLIRFRRRISYAAAVAFRTVAIAALIAVGPTVTRAQTTDVHYPHRADMPPGAVGQQQLLRGGPRPGYFQPVEIVGPEGAMVAVAVGGRFESLQPSPVKVGMLIGQVYRVRVTRIPQRPGLEVYPTIEVIDRLYPPGGNEQRFPIPVHLTTEELQLALDGKFVTRVIYLERPQDAIAVADEPSFQRYFEALPGENLLKTADRLGRPMAILRIGSRAPDRGGPDETFLFGSPPLENYGPSGNTTSVSAASVSYLQPAGARQASPAVRSQAGRDVSPALRPARLPKWLPGPERNKR